MLQLTHQEAQANKLSIIRDEETELAIRSLALPLLRAAGLEPDSINLYIVNAPTLNAFVAGGLNIFIHTGLLARSESASQVIGVLAHEIGHISGGHLSRLATAQHKASNEALIGTLLGGAAALLGNTNAATALVSGGLHVGTRNFLRFSRNQEMSADRAALRYLDKTRQSAKGMLNFLQLLSNQELLTTSNQDPYVRTHPPSLQRIKFLRNHISKSRYSNVSTANHIEEMYGRIKAKIGAFIQPINQTMRAYPVSDISVQARYARAIAYYRKPDLEAAILLIDGLITEMPNDAYFHELKGQILFENGYARKALLAYERSVQLLPDASLIRANLGQIQLELNDPTLLPFAVANFKISLDKTPQRAFIWRQLGIAYGKLNKMGKSSRALAEEALLRGRRDDAIRFAKKAKTILPQDSPDWIRAEDIIVTTKQSERKR